MKIHDITEAAKQELPKQRNPVATYAQRSGAGAHKDQNKKTTPLRKEKHKKKDLAFENQQLNEFVPLGAAAMWVLRWVGMKAAWPLFKWALKKMFKLGIIGFGTYTVADWTWDKIEEMLGAEAVQLLQEHGIELALAAAFVISAIVVKRWIEKKGDELLANKNAVAEKYTQKDGDYARGNVPMPKKKRRGPHPLGGKLVGGS